MWAKLGTVCEITQKGRGRVPAAEDNAVSKTLISHRLPPIIEAALSS